MALTVIFVLHIFQLAKMKKQGDQDKEDPIEHQLIDMLWNDPIAKQGTCPNAQRGGGRYWGPDITQSVLDRLGMDLLVRSHECKLPGFAWSHGKKCLTVFSASNYYKEGSNKVG